jgi:hypothetical protein
MKNEPDPTLEQTSNLSNEIKKVNLKSQETYPLKEGRALCYTFVNRLLWMLIFINVTQRSSSS